MADQIKLRVHIEKFRPLSGWWDTVSVGSNMLNRAEQRWLLNHLRSLADRLEARMEKDDHAKWENKHCRCKICGSPTKQLKTTEGDPEGIRHDRICTNPKCKRKHGMTKAHFFAFHLYPVKGKKKPVEAP